MYTGVTLSDVASLISRRGNAAANRSGSRDTVIRSDLVIIHVLNVVGVSCVAVQWPLLKTIYSARRKVGRGIVSGCAIRSSGMLVRGDAVTFAINKDDLLVQCHANNLSAMRVSAV